jgi:hypothetical protein
MQSSAPNANGSRYYGYGFDRNGSVLHSPTTPNGTGLIAGAGQDQGNTDSSAGSNRSARTGNDRPRHFLDQEDDKAASSRRDSGAYGSKKDEEGGLPMPAAANGTIEGSGTVRRARISESEPRRGLRVHWARFIVSLFSIYDIVE